MSFEVFMLGLFIVSALTGLVTQAIKKWKDERGKTYYANALAGYVSVAVSFVVSAGYVILTDTAINAKLAVYLISLILLSWIGAMIGYDKVIQTIAQIRTYKKGE